jgi:glycerol kinase
MHLLAIDQGTTGTTCLLVNAQQQVIDRAYREFPQIYPQPGWVEHDPEAIWDSVIATIGELMARHPDVSLAAIGITNQRETTVVWERASGRPVHHAIVWQCRRTADFCDRLRQAGLAEPFHQKTGLVLDPYFSGTKLRWILDHTDNHARAQAGELAFGTIDSFLIHRLTGQAVHATDVTNASRTLMMDLQTCTWDSWCLEQLGVPREVLPEIRSCDSFYGTTQGLPGLPDGVPIHGVLGDQHAALFGQACFDPGDAKCTYGTGAFLLANVGSKPVFSNRGLLATPAWKLGGETTYALEGATFIAGAAVQWFRDGLGLIESAAEIEALAASVADSGEVVFVPALAGLGAPHWRAEARGAFFGLSRGTTKAHLARALLDGIALQIVDLLKAMSADSGTTINRLRVDGGAAANDLLMQTQADLLGVSVDRPSMLEATGLGAALVAGLGSGLFHSLDDLRHTSSQERCFDAEQNDAWRQGQMKRWADAVARC